jgi:hypothetical protein
MYLAKWAGGGCEDNVTDRYNRMEQHAKGDEFSESKGKREVSVVMLGCGKRG